MGAALLVVWATTAVAQSRTVYLNRDGATLRPGTNDTRAHTSTVVSQPTTIAPWETTDALWTATVACMRETWSRFDVTFVETDPGSTPHMEALFGGTAADIGRPLNIAGIAPFAADCSIVENATVFAFVDSLPQDAQLICEVMSQELGHAYGLDHVLLASDPMSYLSFDGEKRFQDTPAACGEKTARPCGLGATACRAQQSSVQILLARLGSASGDGTAPTLSITSPAAHATVSAGFTVKATAADDQEVTGVTFYVDGAKVGSAAAPPYELATDEALADGMHTVMVEARDASGNMTVREVSVTVGDTPWFAMGCSAGGAPGIGAALGLLALRRRRRR